MGTSLILPIVKVIGGSKVVKGASDVLGGLVEFREDGRRSIGDILVFRI